MVKEGSPKEGNTPKSANNSLIEHILNSFRGGQFQSKQQRSSNVSELSGVLTPQINKLGKDPKANLKYIRQMLKSHNSANGSGSDLDKDGQPSQIQIGSGSTPDSGILFNKDRSDSGVTSKRRGTFQGLSRQKMFTTADLGTGSDGKTHFNIP